MGFLFPLVVLISSVLISLLLVREGFALTPEEKAKQEARFQALSGTYDQGSLGDGSNVSASAVTARRNANALCNFQTSQCAPSGTTQACCTAANATCVTLTQEAAAYKANTPAARYLEGTWTAKVAKATDACNKATADCVVKESDTACCTGSKLGCTAATAELASAQAAPTFTPGSTGVALPSRSSGTSGSGTSGTSGSGTSNPLSSLTQGDLYNLSRLFRQNETPTPTNVPTFYGSSNRDDEDDQDEYRRRKRNRALAPIPPMEYADPIAIQVGRPKHYPFSTAEMETCETTCD
jgi:hypothetical protein